MASHPYKHFEKVYWLLCTVMFVVVVLRCYFVPFAHDEVATFYFYIQPGDFVPFLSHADANGHFLTSASSWLAFKLFGSSPFALRLPSLLAFVLLCYGVFRMNKLFGSMAAKIIFSSAFIISFNFISFYSLCRGYGLSMAFLMLGLYYFFIYTRYHSFTHFIKFVGCTQLALCANLTLTLVVALTTVVMLILQTRERVLLTARVLVVHLANIILLGFWVKYAFFLKAEGALYYGGGDNYWLVTFKSLIETITMPGVVVEVLMLVVFAVMCGVCAVKVFRRVPVLKDNFVLSFLMFVTLVLAFYLLKKVVGVNYPEDRTGLFFYLFFMVALCFMISELRSGFQLIFLYIPLFFIFHLALLSNIRVHPWRVYETMPQRFFDRLVKEQEKGERRITVAGHRVREFFYGFMNYNSSKKLNHMTAPEALQMNCDFALAYQHEKPYYDKYYQELDKDEYWGFVLLGRRRPIVRELLFEHGNITVLGSAEYSNAIELLDTLLPGSEPLQASFEIDVHHAPVPFNAWLVLQVDGQNPDSNIFVRTPLDLVGHNWNGHGLTLDLVTGNVPARPKRLVAYLWNIKGSDIDLVIRSFKLYRLKGDGIKEISKANI